MPDTVFPGDTAVNPAFPAVRSQDSAENFDGGAFACPIRPYVTYHFPILYGEGNVVQCPDHFIFPPKQAAEGMAKASVTPCHAVGFGNMRYFNHEKKSPLSRETNRDYALRRQESPLPRAQIGEWEQEENISEARYSGPAEKDRIYSCKER